MRHFSLSSGILTLILMFCVAAPGARAQDSGKKPRVLPLPSPPKGLSFSLNWDRDIYDNIDGGRKRGYAIDSVVSAHFGLDTGELGWWQGGQLFLGAQAIDSTHPSQYVGDLQTLSNLDAPNRRQVSKFWYSQRIGPAVVRGGVMDVNSFFDVNDAALLFTNSSFGITPSMTVDVPTATYPDSGWGLMTRLGSNTDNWLVGVFQGNPTDRSTALHDGAMAIAERGWRMPRNSTHVGIGAWYRQVPESGGPPTHDWGAYANLQRALPGHPDAVAFVQAGVSPGQVNTVPAYLGSGVHFYNVSHVVTEWGIGFARAWIRGHAAETSLEGTALIPIFGGRLDLQPDVQYVFHPSGIYPNALAVALRLHLTFY